MTPFRNQAVRSYALLLTTATLLAPASLAQEEDEGWGGIFQGILSFANDYEVDWSVVQGLPLADQWQGFWSDLEHALHEQSIDELTWMLPEARSALQLLDAVPAAQPYAEWLRQRIDYLEVAEEAARVEPEAGIPARKQESLPAPAKPVLRPPPPVRKPVPVDSPAHIRVTKRVADKDLWRKKVAGRKQPAGAALYAESAKKVFRREGVPPELVWMAEVESTFNPKARSPVGAAGLFQFMPVTAERFGLRLKPVDERLNPDHSATAAAKYLKLLNRRFGDWELALAAYNAGEGRISKALARHEGRTFADIAPHLSAETQMYVPKIAALIELREGKSLTQLPPAGT